MSTDNDLRQLAAIFGQPTMTRAERAALARIIRLRAKLAKLAIDAEANRQLTRLAAADLESAEAALESPQAREFLASMPAAEDER
jgi:hypothetical protein